MNDKWIYLGTAMAFIVSAIPALPGGWGTADAAYVFFFALGGVASSGRAQRPSAPVELMVTFNRRHSDERSCPRPRGP
jgi:hypothetical protein